MVTDRVVLLKGPEPLHEALRDSLALDGLSIRRFPESFTGEFPDGVPTAIITVVDSDECWEQLGELAACAPTVAILPVLRLSDYVRALAAGAYTMLYDTPTAVMVDVIRAAINAEVVLPQPVALAMASRLVGRSDLDGEREPLNPMEEILAGYLTQGWKPARIASELSYSERTIRRKIQGLYLKLGVGDKDTAVALLRSQSADVQSAPTDR